MRISGKSGRSKSRFASPTADVTSSRLLVASAPTSATIVDVADTVPTNAGQHGVAMQQGVSAKCSRILFRRDVGAIVGICFVFVALYSLAELVPTRYAPRRTIGFSDQSRPRVEARMPSLPKTTQIQPENPIATERMRPEEVHTFKFFPPAVHHCALPNNQQDVEELGTAMSFLISGYTVFTYIV